MDTEKDNTLDDSFEEMIDNDFVQEQESEDIIDWDWVSQQSLYVRNKIVKGKQKPKLKKVIRKERRDAEKKYRN